MTELVPGAYRCPDHDDLDLTDGVRAEVESHGDYLVASLNFGFRSPPSQPFRVRVHCPGGAGHVVEFSGSFRP